MKRAFTLIEVLVAVTIVALISGGALIYLNNFNSKQKLNKSKDEVISALKLAQSYAKTRQLPLDSGLSELDFVQVKINSNGFIEARANSDVGPTYFYNAVNNSEITVTSDPTTIYFLGNSGGNLSGESAVVIVENEFEARGSYQITVNALGQISQTSFIE